ncbi:MAG: hypothetical protein WC449_06055 [Candidatus Paceibacterota bacterium]
MKNDAAKKGRVGVVFIGYSVKELEMIMKQYPTIANDYSSAARYAVTFTADSIKGEVRSKK